jgi:hypothetical protein
MRISGRNARFPPDKKSNPRALIAAGLSQMGILYKKGEKVKK